jgi:hypothetical protein
MRRVLAVPKSELDELVERAQKESLRLGDLHPPGRKRGRAGQTKRTKLQGIVFHGLFLARCKTNSMMAHISGKAAINIATDQVSLSQALQRRVPSGVVVCVRT